MLLLKNEIKEVFKAHGMPEGLTVSRTQSKHIAITGQCGEPVLTITKVEVGTKLTKAERSNCVLNSDKLQREFPLKPIKERIKEILVKYKG